VSFSADGQSLIVAGQRVDQALLDQDLPPGRPRMDLAVRAGRCIPRAPSRVALRAPVDGLPLAPPGLALARGPLLVHPGLVQAAPADSRRLQAKLPGHKGRLRNNVVDASSIPRPRKAR
jgi:hypothetical protein